MKNQYVGIGKYFINFFDVDIFFLINILLNNFRTQVRIL